MTAKKKTPQKPLAKTAPLYVQSVTAEERGRLERFAEGVGRPISWVVRDAVTCYIDALEDDVETLREKIANIEITMDGAGKTSLPQRGRPKG